jgi:hypothetical protein
VLDARDLLPDRTLRVLDQQVEIVEVKLRVFGIGLLDHAIDVVESMVLPQVIGILDLARGR